MFYANHLLVESKVNFSQMFSEQLKIKKFK